MERENFGSQFGVLVAVAGSAVGLGNLWRFPYVVGNNGGAAFIILYLLFVILICLPIMFSEFIIGRRGQSNAFGSIKKVAPKSGWLSIGAISVIASLFILSFYSVVGGWTVEYIFKSFSSNFLTRESGSFTSQFELFVQSPVRPVIMHLIFMGLTAIIVIAGVKKGIERYSKILMPLLFFLVILLALRSLTLPGSKAGVEFLFRPDFSKIGGEAILAALGQAFFSLSLGMGCIITYGSYVSKKENLIKISFMSALADTSFAILAGVAVIPAVFAFGISPGEGPSLVFITLPQVFGELPFGQFIAFLFFFILLIAALTSSISLLEVVVAFCTEELKWSRPLSVVATFLLVGFTGSLSSLSQGSLSHLKLFNKNIFDLFDYSSSNLLLPIGGLFVVLFVGWRMKRSEIFDELTNGGEITLKSSLSSTILFLIRYVAPVAIVIVLISSLL